MDFEEKHIERDPVPWIAQSHRPEWALDLAMAKQRIFN